MEWDKVLIALLTGGVLTATIKGIADIIKAKISLHNSFPNTIKTLNYIYDILNELKRNAHSDRVLIISTQNGGGVPRPGAPLYASVLFEVYDHKLDSIRDNWQNRQIDFQYVKLLAELETEEIIAFRTEDMDDGMLKNIYIAHGIDGTIVAKVKVTEKNYFYISCNFTNTKYLNIDANVHVLDAVAKIKDIL